MKENQVMQIFLRLLHKERQEYTENREKKKGLFLKLKRLLCRH